MTDPKSPSRPNGGYAFARGSEYHGGDTGMTLRDYFAAQALPFALKQTRQMLPLDMHPTSVFAAMGNDASELAYGMADDMIAAREGTEQGRDAETARQKVLVEVIQELVEAFAHEHTMRRAGQKAGLERAMDIVRTMQTKSP